MQTSWYFIAYNNINFHIDVEDAIKFKFDEYIQIQSAWDNTNRFMRLLRLQLPVIEDTKIEDINLNHVTYIFIFNPKIRVWFKTYELDTSSIAGNWLWKCGFRVRKGIIRIGTRT